MVCSIRRLARRLHARVDCLRAVHPVRRLDSRLLARSNSVDGMCDLARRLTPILARHFHHETCWRHWQLPRRLVCRTHSAARRLHVQLPRRLARCARCATRRSAAGLYLVERDGLRFDVAMGVPQTQVLE